MAVVNASEDSGHFARFGEHAYEAWRACGGVPWEAPNVAVCGWGGHMLARRSGGRSARWRSQVCALHAAVWGVRLCRGGGMGVWAQDGHRSHPVPQIRRMEERAAPNRECCSVAM